MRKLDVFLLIDTFINNRYSKRYQKELSLFSKKLHCNLSVLDDVYEFELYLRRCGLMAVNDIERELYFSFIKFLNSAKRVCD